MKPLKPHPYADLLPMMSESEYATLKADVIANEGFTDDAYEYEGKLLDGRNRQRVSQETGIPLKYKPFKGDDAAALSLVYSKATHRNLNDSQKAAAAVNFLPHFEAIAEKRQRAMLKKGSRGGNLATTVADGGVVLVEGLNRAEWEEQLGGQTRDEIFAQYKAFVEPDATDGAGRAAASMRDKIVSTIFSIAEERWKSRDRAGSLFGVSGRYVQAAKAIKAANPELFDAIFTGRETISRATSQIRRANKRQNAEARAKTGRVIHPDDCEIILGDFLAKSEGLANAWAQLVFADPPYNLGFKYDGDPTKDELSDEEYSRLTYAWIAESARQLKPTGTLCWMVPEEHVALAKMAIIAAGLHVRRCIVWHESFGQAGKNNFGRTCRFIWYATKSKTDFIFNAEAILVESKRATVYGDKRAMPDGKVPDALWDFSRLCGTFDERIADEGVPTQLPVELVKRAVKCFTDPGDRVFDPFGGTGTTARAALSTGRKCVTIERSKKYVGIIKRELANMPGGDK